MLRVHLPMRPLHFFHDVEAAVEDELIQVSDLFVEPGLAVASLLGGAELVLEERVVLGPDYGEVVGHGRERGALIGWSCS